MGKRVGRRGGGSPQRLLRTKLQKKGTQQEYRRGGRSRGALRTDTLATLG